jgi:regulator of protease activity HflC (stomatin/prohibitin superfamily)
MFMIWIILIVIIILVLSSLRVVNQYEQGVVLSLGRFTGIRQAGLRVIFPIFQRMIKVDVRTNTIDIPKQEVITKDNVTINVDAVVYFKVINVQKAVLETTNYIYATSQFAQAALRDVTGNIELDSLLGKRDMVSDQIKAIVDKQTEKWGIDVENVKLQNIELPQDMKRAMAKQAEAERERRAVIITAEGEKSAAQSVADAAEMLSKVAGGISIRTLQTLEKIAVEPSQKTVFVIPADLVDNVKSILGEHK